MSTLVLHKLNASPPARAVMMVGNILGLEFEYVEPDFLGGGLFDPDYIEKNPMHTIPLLEDGDFVLADSHAIVTYLITKYGGDKSCKLYPCDIYTRGVVNSRLYFDTGILFPRLRAVTEPTFLGTLTGPTGEHIQKIEEAYQMLEAYLNKTLYLALDHFTVADICAGATVTSLNMIVPIDCERFPKLIEWFGLLHAETCFQEINSEGVTELIDLLNGFWTRNQNNTMGYGIQAR